MTKSRRKGFTIVEMLAVIGVIAVLISIVVTAASGVIKSSRSNRADVMKKALEQAIATYYAQEGEWPEEIEKKIRNNAESDGEDKYTFRPSEADKILQAVVYKSLGMKGAKSMLIDVSALFVCDQANAGSKKAHGYEFSDVIKKNAKHHIDISQMAFGYQTANGNFCRFKVIYNFRTDAVKVKREDDED